MGFPPESDEISAVDHSFVADFGRCITIERRVDAIRTVILLECSQFSFQVTGIPEEHLIEVLTTSGPDQPFDERMR